MRLQKSDTTNGLTRALGTSVVWVASAWLPLAAQVSHEKHEKQTSIVDSTLRHISWCNHWKPLAFATHDAVYRELSPDFVKEKIASEERR